MNNRAVCLFFMNYDSVKLEMEELNQFLIYETYTYQELQQVVKTKPIFCIVIFCKVRESADVENIIKTGMKFPKIPCLLYGNVITPEIAFQLAEAGVKYHVVVGDRTALLKKNTEHL